MPKDTPIIVIGFGSIGKRHYLNLKQLGFNRIGVFDASEQAFVGEAGVSRVEKLTSNSLAEFKIAFICTPTNLHLKYALLAARAGCHLFIEKPLSHDLKGVNELIKLCRRKKLVNMVACNFRFNEGFKSLKRMVSSDELGQPLTARVVIGHDLSQSRPGVDYRNTYAASRVGGGVILDSGAHAVDYLIDLFGAAKKAHGFLGNISKLEIKSEDFAEVIIKHQAGVVTTLSLDYFSRPKRHRVEIQFTAGWATWDFVKNELTISRADQKSIETKKLYDGSTDDYRRNTMYTEEVAAFMALAARQKTPITQDLSQAKRTLALLLQIKKQAKKI
ncbi:MAG: Gfo/Idh/MocA family oxidoreductase [Patescibacteria group bacterium]